MVKQNQNDKNTQSKKYNNFHLRGVDDETVALIDQEVNRINKRHQNEPGYHKINRSEYLVNMIKHGVYHTMFDYQKTIFDEAVEQISRLIQEYIKATNRVFYLLLTDDKEGALDLYGKLVHDSQLEEFIQGDLGNDQD